uniref:Interferon-inducible double stranded RNA-dependent protein kinase activator A A n=1 Tax=Melanaphis sacchari TaxID=742174 RepID=A0A2H8TCN7_9HEMI
MTLDQNYHINSNETNITINYIGKLQEMCVARGWELPKYEYHQEYDNKNKNCLFYATCSIGPYRSIGAGITKKIAKNQTAQIVFNQINMDQDKTNGTSTSNASSEKSIDSVHDLRINKVINDTANMTLDQNYYINSNETKMPINYIGKLQEICVACGRELPKYEYHQEYDNINKKYLYSVICSVGPYKSTGLADAKQVAKKQAAQLVLNQINMNQQKTSTPSRNFTHETADNSMGDMITPTNIDLCNIFKLTNLYSNQLLSSKNECVQKLKKCNSLDELNMSAFDFLTKLANEEVFGTTYIQYQKDSYEVYMSLEITTLTPTPVLVCLSTGKTEEEAQNAAAKCALKYIKRILI